MSDPQERVAGRELDAEIAERVMGWRWAGFSPHSAWLLSPEDFEYHVTSRPWMGWVEGAHKNATLDLDGGKFTLPSANLTPVPRYSSEISAAWTVAETFIAAGCAAWLEGDGHTGYHAGCTTGAGRFEAHADTPALAICLAAIAATLSSSRAVSHGEVSR
jgi:hypothetical protein